jgi:vibriolysin
VSLLIVAGACFSTPEEGVVDAQGPGRTETVVFQNLDLQILDTDEQGLPNFIVGKIGQIGVTSSDHAENVERAMLPILQKAAPYFRMKAEEMSLSGAHTDKEGDQHFRFKQFKNGLEVLGGEVIVHVRDGVVNAVNGSARGDMEAPVDVKVEPDAALTFAKRATVDMTEVAIGGELPLAYKMVGERLEMVYLVDVTGVDAHQTPVHDTVLISTVDGSIIGRIPHIFTVQNREVHNLTNGTALPGPTSRIEGGALNADAVVNSNYDRLGTTWACYKNLFARDSFDGLGAKLISSVHYSTKYNNAYWNGTQMVYGDGDGVTLGQLGASMDVTAHELTHAVTERTSGLVYSSESGGLNESMSDIFGNVCEWYGIGQPATPSANNFLVGEDIYTPNGSTTDALRYMSDPFKDGGSADYWTSTVGTLDVHYSSGVSNLAFSLLAKGGTHPRGKSTIVVTGIGMAKAAQIFYKANTTYLTANATFATAKTACESAATALGYTAAEKASVTAAWQAVGVGVSGGGTTCAHDKCASGTSLASTCNSVVTSVCATDAYCCTTSWDSTCIAEGRTLGKSLKCAEANGACTHNICTTGVKLVSGCDSAKSACVAKICAADAYCCGTSWDATCVGRVATNCALNCN